MRLGSWLVAAASVHRGLALRGGRWALRSDETEARRRCTEDSWPARARVVVAANQTVTPVSDANAKVACVVTTLIILVSEEVVGNQMRVVDESLTLSSARRECGLVAGDQSAARFAWVIIGHVGGDDVHTVSGCT